jgi:cytochrome c
MKHLLRLSIAFIFTVAFVGTALGQKPGTAPEAKQMVQDALAHIKDVGPEKAFQDFSTPEGRWHEKDVYLFCYKLDGTTMCHGANAALIGKNLIDMKTADGQLLIKNFVALVTTQGSGWVDYQWPHPQTKKTVAKRAFVEKIPGYDGLIGAGFYPQ